MKTISGSAISSKPISLSKAASVLNNFISTETGASQAVLAYLRRASVSFNELAQCHRELKPGRSERKRKKTHLEILDNGNITDTGKNARQDGMAIDRGRNIDLEEEQSLRYSENFEEMGIIDLGGRSGRKKKKRSDFRPEAEDKECRDRVEIEEKKSKERKKRKKVEVEDGGSDDSDERHRKKKKKKMMRYEDEN